MARETSRATAWVGKAVAETLNLNVREPAVKKRILGMIKIWLDSGALRIVESRRRSPPQKRIRRGWRMGHLTAKVALRLRQSGIG